MIQWVMSKLKKFSSQMDEKLLEELRSWAKENNTDISALITEAVADLLEKKNIRPAFRKAKDEIIAQFNEDLKELAK